MAMLPILQNELVQNKKWVTEEEIIDYMALSQSLPGIIAVNVASFIGYRKRKIFGVIIAGLGVVSPCIIIILLIASFINDFKKLDFVKHAFAGITIGVSALIFNAVISLWKKSVIDKTTFMIFVITFLTMILIDISPIILVIFSAIIGITIKKMGIKS